MWQCRDSVCRLRVAAGLQAYQRALLCHLHLVERVLHLGPRLVALVDDEKLVRCGVAQVHRARDVLAVVRRVHHVHLDSGHAPHYFGSSLYSLPTS